jgi:hypothetical protein
MLIKTRSFEIEITRRSIYFRCGGRDWFLSRD